MINPTVDWTTFRSFVSSRNLSIQYIYLNSTYYFYAADDGFAFTCNIPDDGSQQFAVNDFTANFKASANQKFTQDSNPTVNTDAFKLAADSITGIALAGQTTNIDYQITATKYIRGLELLCKNQAFGDYACLQAIDKDNVLGFGANTVLNTFVNKWCMADDRVSQGLIIQPFRAKMPQGVYLRIAYTSTGIVNVPIAFNMVIDVKVVPGS